MNKAKSGFTIIELVLASSIMTLVFAGLGTVFIQLQRISRRTFAEAEFALATRELRDKLLFEIAPPGSNRRYAGLLSATAHSANYSIDATVPYVDRSDGSRSVAPAAASWTVASRWNAARAANDCYLGGGVDSSHPLWLFASSLPYTWDWSSWNDSGHAGKGFIDSEAYWSSRDASGNSGAYYFLNIRYTDSSTGVDRSERAAVTVFGKRQRTIDGRTFDE